jgi:hypothetical protein
MRYARITRAALWQQGAPMFRETYDFGVDVADGEIAIVQKNPEAKKAGRAVVSAKNLHLLKHWLDEAANEARRQKQPAPTR